MTWIETIDKGEATGSLKEAYDAYLAKSGGEQIPSILKLFSLSPEAYHHHYEYYKQITYGKGPLRRYQREMIAVTVSTINHCHY